MNRNKKIILSSMLLALLIVLSRFFSIETQFLVLSFGFIPTIISAIWLGPRYSMMIAALGDLIGALLFPFGAYFPGFTISAAISGWIYGVFLYNRDNTCTNEKKILLKLIICSVLVLGGVNIFVNSFWLHVLYGKAYYAIIGARAVSQIIMFPIQIIVMYMLNKFLNPIIDKYLMED